MINGKVSVIIPAYNTELYIENCIESVEKQTYKNFEIIIVNDGSTDKTLEKINKCIKKYNNIKLINITNHGQGYGRNIALKNATGNYILFLDSDDFIEDITLEQCVKKIEEDKSDLVVFDWKEYFYNRNRYRYANHDDFFKNKILENEQVTELFKIKHYFTVNKLYSKEFLIKNNIKYGEGYIYEDNPFWVKIVINAKKVSLLPSPLYNVGIALKSTTRNDINTDKHYIGYISAVRETINSIKEKPDLDYSDLYNYIMKKFNLYYKKRVPKQYKKQFLNDYISVMSEMVPLKSYNIRNSLIRIACKHDIFKKNKKMEFYFLYKIFWIKRNMKIVLKKIKKSLKPDIENLRNNIRYLFNVPSSYPKKIYRKCIKEVLQPNILFMGFDYRYTGNSRYLFEKLLKKGYKNIKFVTMQNEELEEEFRIEPQSKEMFENMYTSKIIVFESWIPNKFIKRNNQIWVQLWHGSPLKKMLFDSDEGEIIEKSPKHKVNKYNDIQRWDFLLSDNPTINNFFRTSFLIKKEKIINYGYPRVRYLLDNKDNEKLKQSIREKVGINKEKKVVLYLPTWRDYNYGKQEEEYDRSYILNIKELQEKLGEKYEVIEKNHTFLQGNDKEMMHNTNIETQELLLISDFLITDYSSVMFDGFGMNIPVLIYANDFQKYQESRGVYTEIWQDLNDYITTTIDELTDKINNYDMKEYKKIKDKYAYKNVNEDELEEFVEELLTYRVEE